MRVRLVESDPGSDARRGRLLGRARSRAARAGVGFAWLAVFASAVAVGLALLPASASGSTTCAKTWIGGFSSNWEDWQNWTQCDASPNNQEAPDGDDAVSIDNANVNLSSGTSIASLTLGHTTAATLTVSAANFNTNLVSGGDVVVNAGSTLTLTCPGAGCAGGSGGAPTVNVGANTLTNSGTITITADASGGGGFLGNLNNSGAINVDGNATSRPNGGNAIIDNTGTITIANGMALSSGGSSCGDTSTNVIDDTGGQIIANGTGTLAAVNYTQGGGTTGGSATYPVNQQCGYLHYTGTGASTVLANYGLKLTGATHAGQNLTIRADHNNTNADASASGFTNGGNLTLDCQIAGCAGGPGGAPSINVGTNTLTNTGTITITANASGGGGFLGNLNNSGAINVDGNATSRPNGGNATIDNTGTITIANGMALSSGGSSCADTSASVIDDTGGQIIANGTGALAPTNYTQGNGTTGGSATYPVVQQCGYLHYTGTGASTVLATYGLKLTGATHAGQNLTIRADHFNTNADASASGFTNGGNLTLDCQAAGCAGGPGGAPSINVGTNTLTNTGTITVTAAASGGNGFVGNLSNSGTINVDGDVGLSGGTLSQSAGHTTIASGAHFNANGTMTMSGGTLSGAGTLTGSVSNTGGTVAPGSSPGTLSITGSYTQGAGGTLQIAVNGTSAGAFSVLSLGGSPTLGGTLALVPSAGYAAAAAAGEKVGFLTYTGALSGTFATTTVNPSLKNGGQFAPDYTPTGRVDAVVSITAPKLSGAGLFPRAFQAKKGTTLKLTLSQPAAITGVVKAKAKHRKGRTLTLNGNAGPNNFKLKLRGLKPGKYKLTLVAVNGGGLSSNSVTLGFTIKKPKK